MPPDKTLSSAASFYTNESTCLIIDLTLHTLDRDVPGGRSTAKTIRKAFAHSRSLPGHPRGAAFPPTVGSLPSVTARASTELRRNCAFHRTSSRAASRSPLVRAFVEHSSRSAPVFGTNISSREEHVRTPIRTCYTRLREHRYLTILRRRVVVVVVVVLRRKSNLAERNRSS